MSKIKTKELIICLISIIFLILTLVTDVFASGVDTLPQGNNTNNTNNTFETIPSIDNNTNNTTNNLNNTNNTTNNLNNTNSNRNNNTNSNRNNTTTIPNTGVDYSVVFIIAICGISAIYAYKKIRDYNNL